MNNTSQAWQLKLIQLLAVGGIVVAYFLLLYHEGVVSSACGTNNWSNCDAVSGPDAAFSSLGPIPVAALGLVGYITIFMLVWSQDVVPFVRQYMRELMMGVVSFALLFTGFLTALEAFVLHAWCQYCLLSAAIIVAMFALSISYLRTPKLAE
jgi:uncharacterized membrane protein